MSFMSLSPCCLQGGTLTGTPHGVNEEIDESIGREVMRYHATPSDGVIVDKKAALILFTDAIGFAVPNPKIMADAFAEQLKINVFVPEYIPNPPPVQPFEDVMPLYPEQFASRSWASTIWSWMRVIWFAGSFIPRMLNPKNQLPLAEKSIRELQKEGYEKLAAIGYCRGGAMIEYLMSSGDNSPFVGGVICHPSPEVATWGGITKPTSWHLSDHDPMFTPKKIEQLEELFNKKKEDQGVEFDYTVYKDTVHGFASRPTLDHELTKEAFDRCNASAVTFFKKHLLGE